ncbi:alanyl-tRNA editing protein [Azospirillum thermophilum]|uniref:Synthetase n=1 Tax=Azospirillum thermophilum TaxID=2202148 RepID=A0A2S2CV00_9PROT|nr:alanyl-tRNA editing protein [Azospirillum thermophilum]AWK88200.1 synthetase [Azospirillum thermophilum]
MTMLSRATRKLYYEDAYRKRCTAAVVKTGADHVELDATVAYPEGGGQEADCGVIRTAGGEVLRFIGARKLYGSPVNLPDVPDIEAGGVIQHIVHPDDVAALSRLAAGEAAEIEIDADRRSRLSLSHTASHLLYIAIGMVRADLDVIGCHIKPDGARFDFRVRDRFTETEIRTIETLANGFVERASDIRTYSHDTVPDARYWECEGHVIPCGGTHLDNTRAVGPLQVKRKNLGAGKERISCSFAEARYDLGRYH